MCSIDLVVLSIMHHIGSMCLHQLNSDILYSAVNYTICQQILDVQHLAYVSDILDKAISERHVSIIISALFTYQVCLLHLFAQPHG